ncbi:phospholipase D family protein [Bacillus cereus]
MFRIFNQPYDGTLENELVGFMENHEQIESIFIVVAYAKVSGVSKLSTYFSELISQGCEINVCVGIDQRNTSSDALQQLLDCTSNLYVYHIDNLSITFHPKIYYIKSNSTQIIFIGSNNLTQGGLETNDEVFTSNTTLDDEVLTRLNSLQNRYTDTTSPFCKRVDSDLINQLLSNNYIQSESQINSQLRTSQAQTRNHSRDPLFGSTSRTSRSRRTNITESPNIENIDADIHTNASYDYIPTEDIIELLEEFETYDTIYGGYENFIDVITGSKGYYHIPQGVHLGHIFYIINSLGNQLHNPLDYRLTLFNERTTGSNGALVRQTKYKLAVAMELLLVNDIRIHDPLTGDFKWELTNNGLILHQILNDYVQDPNDFYGFIGDDPNTWRMVNNANYYVDFIRSLPSDYRNLVLRIFSNLQLLNITIDCINNLEDDAIQREYFYTDLWMEPRIRHLLNLLELNIPTRTSLEHRIPFLINLLVAFNIISENDNNFIKII